MRKAVSAAEANRQFSAVLRDVRDGETYVITSHGKPVAKLVPFDAERDAQEAARATLFARLKTQRASRPAGRWTRDELYED
jgi:prevent-host-death family protein